MDQKLRRNKQRNSKKSSGIDDLRGFLVRVARFERAASCSQGKRPTPGLHPDIKLLQLYHKKQVKKRLLPLWSKMWSNGDYRSFRGEVKVPKPQCLQWVAGFRISPDGRGCYTLPNHALRHLSCTRIFAVRSNRTVLRKPLGYYILLQPVCQALDSTRAALFHGGAGRSGL